MQCVLLRLRAALCSATGGDLLVVVYRRRTVKVFRRFSSAADHRQLREPTTRENPTAPPILRTRRTTSGLKCTFSIRGEI